MMIKNYVTALKNDKRGAGFTKYLIILGPVAIFGITAFTTFGESIGTKTGEFQTAVDGL